MRVCKHANAMHITRSNVYATLVLTDTWCISPWDRQFSLHDDQSQEKGGNMRVQEETHFFD